MSNDRLRFDLTDLADEVTPVNLQDRVLRTSRKIGIQRAVTTSVAALAVVAAVSAGAFAAIPHGKPSNIPAGTHTTTAPAPSVSASKPPKPPTNPGPSLSTGTQSNLLTGTTFYVTRLSTGTPSSPKVGATVLHKVVGGVDHLAMTLPDSAGQCPYYTVSVSPGGNRIAWITDAGQLYVANADGSQPKKVTTVSACLGGAAIRWWSDTYFTGPLVGRNTIGVDATNGTVSNHNVPISQQGPVSPNGSYIAAKTQSGQWYVARLGNSGRRNISYTLPASYVGVNGWSVHSVSNDGRYVAIGTNPTDSSRNTGSFTVVDVNTNKVVNLPVTGAVHIEFLVNGMALVTTKTQYVLLDASFHKVASESTNLGSLGTWLTYIP